MALAIYPENTEGTILSIKVAENATNLAIRYVASTTVTETITYVDKSIEDVAQEINLLDIPVRAVPLSRGLLLSQGDLTRVGDGDFTAIPGQFTAYDRTTNKGVIVRLNRITVRQKRLSQIKLLQPYLETALLPWYPRISVGSFTQKEGNKTYKFSVPEYDNQTWSLKYGKPFRDVKGNKPVIIATNAIQVTRYPIYYDGTNILVTNGETPINPSTIQDVDPINGIIYFNENFVITDELTVDYTYYENTYEYKEININGHFSQNPLLLDKYVLLYAKPTESSQGLNSSRSIYHIVADSIPEAIDSIPVDSLGTPIAIIGAYNIQQIFASDKASMLDTRVLGGGLVDIKGPKSPVHRLDDLFDDETNQIPIEDRYTYSKDCWDIGNWEGETYPAAAAVVMTLPEELKEVLPISDLKERASKFLTAGVYPVVDFEKRSLPQVTGNARQVSAVYNTALNGQYGWLPTNYETYGSVLTGAWTPEFNVSVNLKRIDNSDVIEVSPNTGYYQPYLKSTPHAGISWEERELRTIEGSPNSEAIYTSWTEKHYLDVRPVSGNQLVKGFVTFQPSNTTKQYRNIKVNSPINYNRLFLLEVENHLKEITNATLELAPSGYVTYDYTSVTDPASKVVTSNYMLSDARLDYILDLHNTPLGDQFSGKITQIADSILSNGAVNTSSFPKIFQPNITGFALNNGEVSGLRFSDIVESYNKALHIRKFDIAPSDYTAAFETSKKFIDQISFSEAIAERPYNQGYPYSWVITSAGGSIATDAILSGININTPELYGFGYADIALNGGDYSFYNYTLPSLFSYLTTYTGYTGATNISYLDRTFRILSNSAVTRAQLTFRTPPTISGLPAINNWFVTYNKYGSVGGNIVKHTIESYDYFYDALTSEGTLRYINTPTYGSAVQLNSLFNSIQSILVNGYSGFSEALLKGGILESDAAYMLYGYGWYLNNWDKHYGTTAAIANKDYRPLFSGFFLSGIKALSKSLVTTEGNIYESTYVEQSPGPFRPHVPYKIFWPLAEAVAYNTESNGLAQAIFNSVTGQYSLSGIYYRDPLKVNDQAAKDNNVAKGLTRLYKSLLNQTGYFRWEPQTSGFYYMRGTEYYGLLESNTGHVINGQYTAWSGVSNPHAIWQYYNNEDVSRELAILSDNGFNTVNIYLSDQQLSDSVVRSNVSSFLRNCESERLRVIPTIWNGTGIYSANMTGLVSSSQWFISDPATRTTGSLINDTSYLDYTISLCDSSVSVNLWNVAHLPIVASEDDTKFYNYTAKYIKENGTNVLCSIVLGDKIPAQCITRTGAIPMNPLDTSLSTPLIYSPYIDYIGIKPNRLLPGIERLYRAKVTGANKPTINMGGNSKYQGYDYTRFTSYIMPNAFVPSSGYNMSPRKYSEGVLFNDGTTRYYPDIANTIASAQYRERPVTPAAQKNKADGFYFFEDYYNPTYRSFELLTELSNWDFRVDLYPLSGNSSWATGEYRRQRDLLFETQAALDTINDSYLRANNYAEYGVLSIEQQNKLNYYRNKFSEGDWVSNTSNVWQSGDGYDYLKYGNFFTSWGKDLYQIIYDLRLYA